MTFKSHLRVGLPFLIAGLVMNFPGPSAHLYAQENIKPGGPASSIASQKSDNPPLEQRPVDFSSQQESDQLDFAGGLLSRGMYDMAISQYQKFIADYPKSHSLQEAYLSMGEGYFLSRNFDKAVETFNQLKGLFPNSDRLPVCFLRLGQIDIEQKKYDEAIKELSSLDASKQLKGQMLQNFEYYTAMAYLGKSDSANALDYFQKASQVEGTSALTAYALKQAAQIQASNGHYSEALDAYGKAITSADDDALKGELIYRMAEVQFLSGKYDEAIKAFGNLLSSYPNSDFFQDALANLLLAYFNSGQYDRLLGEYQKYGDKIKDNEAYFNVHVTSAMAYIELKNFDRANALLDRILAFPELKPYESARIFIKKADIFIREKNYKDALALLEAYASADTKEADEALFLKAQCYYGLEDFDHAFNYFENVYQNFPQSRFAKAALLGEAHTRQKANRFKEAQVLFLKYSDIQDTPELKAEALFDAVMMAFKAGDWAATISTARDYLKLYPDGPKYGDVLLTLADSLGQDNQPKEAIQLLQGYLASPKSSQRPNSAYFLLGYNQQLLGNSDQAIESYAAVDKQKEEGKFYQAALKNSAIIYLNQKKEDEAKIYFDRLISESGQNDLQVKTYIWVCNEYLKEQKFSDVLRIAEQAQKRFSPQELMEIRYFKAEALRGNGNCDEADKDYDLVLSSETKSVYTGSAYIGYGLCLEKANKFNEAKAQLQKALDENADDFTITLHARFEMAKVEAALGNLDNALKYYLLVATIYDDKYYCPESLLAAAKIAENQKHNAEALKMYSEILDKYKDSKAALEAKTRMELLK